MEKLLEEMHRRLPNTHIIVMAILPKVLPRTQTAPLTGLDKLKSLPKKRT